MSGSSMPRGYEGGGWSRVGVLSGYPDALVSDELVAEAAHRDQAARPGGLALDLAADVEDVRVAGALVADEARLPQVLHDLAPADGAAGILREQREQAE